MARAEQFFLAALLCVGTSVGIQAQAIVDSTGGTAGSYTTIADALATNEAEIIVKNTGVYQEGVLITRDVIVRGEDPNNPPVIAMKALASQPALGPGDGIYIGGDGLSSDNLEITFKDFVVIPALTDGPTDDAFSVSPNPGAILDVTIENVVCAPNDGTDKPLATSVWDDPDLSASGVVTIPDDGIYLMDEDFDGFDGDIQTTLKDFVIIGVGGDAFVLWPGNNGAASITGSGLGASYAGRYALQLSDQNPVTITGTQENPGWVARKNTIGLIFFQGSDVNLDHIVAVDNNNCGLRIDSDSNINVSISDSLFARNTIQGIMIPWTPPVAKTWTISDCTFFNNDLSNGDWTNLELTSDVTADLTLNVNDCIFAGPEAEAILNTNANVIANNCAFVTAGPYALPSAFVGTPPTENGTVNDDPDFVNVDTDPLLDDSFDVQAAAYATASSTAGPLNGWGDGPFALVSDWSVY